MTEGTASPLLLHPVALTLPDLLSYRAILCYCLSHKGARLARLQLTNALYFQHLEHNGYWKIVYRQRLPMLPQKTGCVQVCVCFTWCNQGVSLFGIHVNHPTQVSVTYQESRNKVYDLQGAHFQLSKACVAFLFIITMCYDFDIGTGLTT